MTELTWQKPQSVRAAPRTGSSQRLQFLIGGALILVAIGVLVINGTLTGAQYYITVEQMLNDVDYIGQPLRVTGAVVGDTIRTYSQTINGRETQVIEFEIAHLPANYTDLALALNAAANNPNAARVFVRVEGQPTPDLLQHEAQAILTGTLGTDGIFRANELLLKCPTRMTEGRPDLSGEGA
ncbi:MAG: cytochrome c maturation protein CcmE [Chloroflexi bacterium]|nr:cytochrome c maturation protein CcmE [Chloroflexota bacterium]